VEIFSGEIEKGCGNQVFDYGKNIDLVQESDLERTPTPAMDKVSLVGSILPERAKIKSSLDPSHRRSHSKEEVRRSRPKSTRKSVSSEKLSTKETSKQKSPNRLPPPSSQKSPRGALLALSVFNVSTHR
jgi:hypothetical protein